MEITGDLNVSIEERTLIDMHSVLNVLNVLIFEFSALSEHLGGVPEIDGMHDRVVETAELLRDPDEASRQVANVDRFIEDAERVIASEVANTGSEGDPVVQAIVGNVRSIFSILEVRAAEIVARAEDPLAWVNHDVRKLKNNFVSVLQAIERNSMGGYRIVYNLAEHEAGYYMVTFNISSVSGATIAMPAVFQDVMRDLLANARKYTPPGGSITAGLHHSGDELRYVVSDTGMGIPPDEISRVVRFGFRGSNVGDRPTRGGGFGLTKAYHVTRMFGGRMWIDSPVVGGVGTRIEIRLPAPNR
ncbi:MAG: ATP-binding protein [Alkalispirochaeta sp.]